MSQSDTERLRRWRLALGREAEESTGVRLQGDDDARDRVLRQLYGSAGAGFGGSGPTAARWLGDIRTYFPTSVVRVMQRDAFTRSGLGEFLLQPELLETVQPDLALVEQLVGLADVIPDESRETARAVVRTVVEELERELHQEMRQAIRGALDRTVRTNRPRPGDIDWLRTISANLHRYQPELGTIVPERLIGHGRRSGSVEREIVLCIDQSGSMASSVVYASVFGSVLASIRSLRTRLVVFDTSVVDLTDELDDPVDLLFGVQLGGGTDIGAALGYCQTRITRPSDTIVVLISDLYEQGATDELLARSRAIRDSGATMVCLLALSDEGAPLHDEDHAAALAELGIPAFACTPDLFPELMAAAIERRDLPRWVHRRQHEAATPLPH